MQSTKRIWTCAYYLSTYIRDIDQKKTKYMCVRERKQKTNCWLSIISRGEDTNIAFICRWMNDTLNTERLVNMSGEKIAIETFMFKRITSKWNWMCEWNEMIEFYRYVIFSSLNYNCSLKNLNISYGVTSGWSSSVAVGIGQCTVVDLH